MKKFLRGFSAFLAVTLIVLAGTSLSTRAADSLFTKYAPDDTNGVALVEVAKILASKPAREIIGNQSAVRFFTDKLFERRNDAKLAERWNDSKFPKLLDGVLEQTERAQWLFIHKREVVILLEGKYNAQGLARELKEAVLGYKLPYNVDAWGNQHELVTFGDKTFGVSMISDTLLAFGDRTGVEAVLGRIDGKAEPKLDKMLIAALADLTPDHALVGAMVEGAGGPAATQPGAAEMKTMMTGVFDVDDQNIRGLGTVVVQNDKIAADAEADVAKELQRAADELGRSPRAMPVVKLYKEAKISRNGNKLTIEMTLPTTSAATALSALFTPPSDIDLESELAGLPDNARGVAISSDGKLVASASGSKWAPNVPPDTETESLIVWDATTRQPVFEQTFKGKGMGRSYEGLVVRFDQANQRLAVSAELERYGPMDSGEIIVFDLATKREAKRIEGRHGVSSPDGRYFAYYSSEGIEIVEAKTWEKINWIANPNARGIIVNGLEFSPDGQSLAAITGGERAELTIWKSQTGEKLDTISLDKQKEMVRFAWSPDGRAIAIVSRDGSLHVVDRAAHHETHTFDLFHEFPEVTGIAFVSEGTKLAACSRTLTRVIDLHGGESLILRAPDPAYHCDLAYNPATHLLAVGAGRGVCIWRLPAR